MNLFGERDKEKSSSFKIGIGHNYDEEKTFTIEATSRKDATRQAFKHLDPEADWDSVTVKRKKW